MLELLDQAPQCDPVQESPWCTWVLDATGNEWLAASADWLIAKPLKIVIILVVAFIVRYLVRRLIDTLTRPRTGSGSTPAISRPLRERAPQMLSTAVIERRRQRAQTIGSVLKSIATFLILGVAILEILAELGINIGPIVASAGIVGVALGFGAQNLVRDFLSGMFMMVEDQYGVGDFVDVGEAAGTVEAVGLRVTTLRDLNGTVWYVRNGEILRVGNSSQGFAVAVVDVPLAHKSDLSLATSLIAEVAEQVAAEPPVSDAVLEPAEVLGVESVTVEGIQLRLTVKVKPGEQWSVQRVLRGRITSALKEAGFDSPLARIFGPQQNNSAQ
ncbi:MAG: mechanosensitive ion channel family protein [Haloechinothrix sp.]